MRIPLDYYRILGLPIQADAQQLSQAYHDRALQLPRREYSDLAINTRKQLLDEAYTILSDDERRGEYDQTFLSAAPADATGGATGPTLDIHPEQFVGALLLLYELGEYELVLQLSEPLLRSEAVLVPEQMQLVNNPLTRADIVLTVALSCLELGREQWQQGQSDAAAQTGHYGQELLLREGLFPGIRGELQTDMYKLRPYRILELLTQAESETEPRQKGIRLLQDMLAERGGIEGKGDDQSGLSLDDFLRFIQQIRNHLTTLEQQELFLKEAERPSAVGMYLLIYAEIAHGFAYCQPPAIAQAQKRLQRLGQHQDVYLEQAVCALLLGQTGAATRALERSQEYEPLAFIREQSKDSPDLLPGLCLYGERWLQTEVFPHFRDLANQTLDLKDYFANEEVQAHLEQLATGQRTATPTAAKVSMPVVSPPPAPAAASPAIAPQETDSAVAVVEPPTLLPPTEPVESEPPSSLFEAEDNEDLPIARRSRARADRLASIQNTRLTLIGIGGLVAVLGIGFFITQIVQLFSPRSGESPETAVETQLPGEDQVPLEISLDQPAVPIPPTAASAVETTDNPEPVTATEEPLDEVLAQEIIQTWLAVKSLALGPEYEINEFATILTEPALGTWQQLASSHQADNTYRNYEHALEIETITTDGNNPDSALIEAAVREEATAYRNGQPDPGGSYDENLRVRYELVRQGDQWLIKDMQVLQ